VQAGNVVQAAGGRTAARGEHLLRRLRRRRRGDVVLVAIAVAAGRRGAPDLRLITASALRLPCAARTGSVDLRTGLRATVSQRANVAACDLVLTLALSAL